MRASTVALRVPSHVVARALAARFGFCITPATSANRSGEPPASDAEEVAERFSELDPVDFPWTGDRHREGRRQPLLR